jgi:hypothetical protein
MTEAVSPIRYYSYCITEFTLFTEALHYVHYSVHFGVPGFDSRLILCGIPLELLVIPVTQNSPIIH